MDKNRILTSVLQLKATELNDAFLDGTVGSNLKTSRAHWLQFRQSNGFGSYANLLTLPSVQHKLKKSKIYTVGLTIQHADVSGVETCAWRGHCTSVCVLDNGNGRYNSVQKARNVKTQFLAQQPEHFLRILGAEIKKHSREQDVVLVRLNVNSDLRWYNILTSLANNQAGMDNVYVYDYTKNPAVLTGNGMVGTRYRIVYSVNESSDMDKVISFIQNGGTAAIVTNRHKTQKTLDSYMGIPLIDGDTSDDRYNESGVWVDLAAKGKARTMGDVGFVRHLY